MIQITYIKSEKTGISYNDKTPQNIINIIDNLYQTKTRVTFDFGDIETGKSWGEVNGIKGTIGKSTGSTKIPLLIHNARSLDGGSLLTHCIVKISESKGGKLIYQHENFKPFNG
jgi:hypothetical protein